MAFSFGGSTGGGGGAQFSFGSAAASSSGSTGSTGSTDWGGWGANTATKAGGTSSSSGSWGGGWGAGTSSSASTSSAWGSTTSSNTGSSTGSAWGAGSWGGAASSSGWGAGATGNTGGWGATSGWGAGSQSAGTQFSDGDGIDSQINSIERAYHPDAPQYRFSTTVYNKVHPALRSKYKPPEGTNQRQYQVAERNNPDPTNLVPVGVKGFEDLTKRIGEQDKANVEYQKKLEEEQKKLVEMRQQHEITTKVEIAKLRKHQSALSHRLLKVMTRIEMQRARDIPLLSEEIEFRRKLESAKRNLAKPAQFQARVTELASIVRLQEDRPNDAAFLPTLDTPNAKHIHEFLEKQRRALAQLTSVIRKDLHDTDTMIKTTVDTRR